MCCVAFNVCPSAPRDLQPGVVGSVCGVWFRRKPLGEGELPGGHLLYAQFSDERVEVAPFQRGRVCQLEHPDGCE
eukprot:2095817-Pyramimonas_sp.AAC.1